MIPYLGSLPKSLGPAIVTLSAVTLALPATALPLWAARPGLAPTGDWYVDASNPNCPGSGAPGDPFCAIQDGIEAASDGDTVHVAPGTYVETIDFLGKAITVASAGGAAVTVIDGNHAGVVVTFQSGETASSVLDGFTITRGVGGVVCNASSPTITRSTITGNTNGDDGGGIRCHTSSPTITHSLISGNEAFHGGGIWCLFGAPTITDSIVEGNTAVGEDIAFGDPGVGGGIYAFATNLTIHRTAIRGNGAASGGGLYCVFSWLTVTNATVHGNTAWGDFYTGLSGEGGGIFSWFPNVANISHTTVSGNHADIGGGIYSNDFRAAAGPTITHSIFWANGSNEASGPVTVTHTNIAGGWGGTGNIDADPLFVDAANGDFRLRLGSPCIDGGDPAVTPTGTDLGGNPRFLDGDLDRTRITDMGAHEFSHVHLDGAGTAAPGGTLTLTTSGTPGMFAFLILGLSPGEVSLGRFGTLLMDRPWTMRPVGFIPRVSTLAIPANLPPVTLYMQELAVSFRKQAGTTGNIVELHVQ